MPVVFSLLNTKCKSLANNYNFLLNSKMIKNVYLGWPDLVTAEVLHNQAWQNARQNGEAKKPDSRLHFIYPVYYCTSINNIHNSLI